MAQNKKLLIIGGVLLVLLLGVGGFFVFGNKSAQEETTQTQSLDDAVISLSPDKIGLKMETRNSNKEVRFVATKLSDAKSLEWEFFYDADIPLKDRTEDGPTTVTQNFGSSEPVNVEGKSSFESPFRELGTCSSGRCRFDTGVKRVNLTIKMIKTDGKVYQIEDSLDLTK